MAPTASVGAYFSASVIRSGFLRRSCNVARVGLVDLRLLGHVLEPQDRCAHQPQHAQQ